MPDRQTASSESLEIAGPHEPAVLTTREQNKAHKRERIKLAARALFADQGFEKTTLRQIADQAGVALGTIMLYADDKRDLVLLMYNEQVASTIATGINKIVQDADVVENFVRFNKVFYRAYGANISLARTYLQLNFYTDGTNTLGLYQNRRRKLDAVRTILEIGQQRGEVRRDAPIEMMAKASLLLYRAAVRSWIAEPDPEIESGVATLRELMELQFHGLSAQAKPKRLKPARRRLSEFPEIGPPAEPPRLFR